MEGGRNPQRVPHRVRSCAEGLYTHRGWLEGKTVCSVEEGPQGRWQAALRQGHTSLQLDPTHPPGDTRLNSRQKLFLPRGRRGERQWGPATWHLGLGLRSWVTGCPPSCPSSSVSPLWPAGLTSCPSSFKPPSRKKSHNYDYNRGPLLRTEGAGEALPGCVSCQHGEDRTPQRGLLGLLWDQQGKHRDRAVIRGVELGPATYMNSHERDELTN